MSSFWERSICPCPETESGKDKNCYKEGNGKAFLFIHVYDKFQNLKGGINQVDATQHNKSAASFFHYHGTF